MRKIKKYAAALTTAVLTASMLLPAVAMEQKAKADEEERTNVRMDYELNRMFIFDVSGKKKAYVSEVKGSKESTPDILLMDNRSTEYSSTVMDLSPFIAKGATLKVYTDQDKTNAVTVKLKAQETKVKAALNLKTNQIDMTINGTAVPVAQLEWRKEFGAWEDMQYTDLTTSKKVTRDFSDFYHKGATLYVRRMASSPGISKEVDCFQAPKLTEVTESDGYFASKEVKVKIKAQAKAPTVKLDGVKGTLAFPKNVEYRFTQGWCGTTQADNIMDDSKGMTGWTKLSEKKTVKVDEFLLKASTTALIVSKAGIIPTNLEGFKDRNGELNPLHAAVIEVRTPATDKKVPSNISEIEIPWQNYITSTAAITKGNIEVSFNYKNLKKTKKFDEVKDYEAVGLTIKNASTASIQYAIADSTDASKIDVKAWKKMKTNATKKFKVAKLPEGKYIAVRIMGANDNKKTKDKNEFTLPTNVVFSDKIDYPDKVASDLSVKWEAVSPVNTSASQAALTVGTSGDTTYTYSYQVVDKAIAGYSIGAKAPAGTKLTAGKKETINVKTDQYVIVYAEKDGVVVKYSCAKASNIS